MKVLLIAVYSHEMVESFEEIGICSIAAFLRENGYEVLLLGAKESKIDYDQITKFKPDIIGLPVYGQSKEAVYRFCGQIRQKLPGVYICVGGFLPTYYGIEMMEENPLIDFVVRGEGELVFQELLSRLEEGATLAGLKGLTYRTSEGIMVNEEQQLIEDINSLPFPSRDLLVDNKIKVAQISNSRGCSGRCTFCCCPNFWKNNGVHKWRGRDVTRMLDEIEYLYKRHGITCFYLIDNSFEDPGSNYKKVWNTAEGILNRNLNISYYLCFRTEFHKKITPELIALLKKSGLCSVFLGIESANESDLKLYGKIASLEDNIKAVKLFREAQINITIGFISVNPYSTIESLRKNIDFLEQYGCACYFPQLRVVKVFKGTKLYSKIEADGLLKEGRFDDEYRYRFIDKKIENLVHFINVYLSSKGLWFFCSSMDFYANDYLVMLAHYKRQFERNQDHEAHRFILEIEAEIRGILYELNQRNAAWFRELLDLAENAWDFKEAYKIMNGYLEENYIKKTYQSLELNKAKMNHGLANLNSSYKIDNYSGILNPELKI